jgi:hypothetical protein
MGTKKYRNNKNLNVYVTHEEDVIDATNGREGNNYMVLYEDEATGQKFVRDNTEFYTKFTEVV